MHVNYDILANTFTIQRHIPKCLFAKMLYLAVSVSTLYLAVNTSYVTLYMILLNSGIYSLRRSNFICGRKPIFRSTTVRGHRQNRVSDTGLYYNTAYHSGHMY